MKNSILIFWNKILDHVSKFYELINSDFKIRILFYIVPTFVILILVALMVMPVGVPAIGTSTGYWWSFAANQEFVGQINKWYWYRKSIVTIAFLMFMVIEIWLWRRLLYSRGKSVILALIMAYLTFVMVPIVIQYLEMGDWKTMSVGIFSSNSWSGPSYMTIATQIDSVPRYLNHMVDYAGVDGQLIGTMRAKAPAFVLTYYAFDQINMWMGNVLGLRSLSLQERGIFVGIDFLLIAGLSIIPLYFIAKKIFTKAIALTCVMIFSLNPMVSTNFAAHSSWNYILLMPITVMALMLLMRGLEKHSWMWIITATVIATIGILFNWAALVLLVLCLLYLAARLFRTSDIAIHNMVRQIPYIVIIIFTIGMIEIGLIWLTTGINMFVSIWDTLVIGFFFDPDFQNSIPNFNAKRLVAYLLSLPLGVFEFFFWCGIPISLQFMLSIIRLKKQEDRGSTALTPGYLLVAVFLLLIAVLAFFGLAVDTRRIWAFLAPVLFIAAMYELIAIKQEKVAISAVLVIFALQTIQVLVCRSVFIVPRL